MASSPITSLQIDEEKVETVTNFLLLDSRILQMVPRAMKLRLLGRKAMNKLGSILKNRDITLLAKIHTVKAMVFPVARYGCESWTIKKS